MQGPLRRDHVQILQINGLKTHFFTRVHTIRAVDGVDLALETNQTLGIVGESGSGKSVTALSIMGLVPSSSGKIVGGEILYGNSGSPTDLAKLNPKGRQMRSIRGNDIAMIFQEPMTSLNPVFTIGRQITEAILLHQEVDRKAARRVAAQMLSEVGIADARRHLASFPHQLSGGMRQRVMIAMALSCDPAILIADEPTTSLDVTIQAQVLALMNRLRHEFNMSIVFITHDLGVIAKMADRVAVMYLGKLMEKAPVGEIFHDARHPYTVGLLRSTPSLLSKGRSGLTPIPGTVPEYGIRPKGCVFAERCSFADDRCKNRQPPSETVGDNHIVACWKPVTGTDRVG
ncbi:MAG: dipeptide/oligopeptide/nickel ABC transporter ATP-binding protein [Spirochaetales bacterium]|nr:dipeptide/oligopeptide/nickel ABC transporter ATP-binding protein [Spirochaetales bacterium]